MTDTGNFRFNSVSSKTHQVVSFLMEKVQEAIGLCRLDNTIL